MNGKLTHASAVDTEDLQQLLMTVADICEIVWFGHSALGGAEHDVTVPEQVPLIRVTLDGGKAMCLMMNMDTTVGGQFDEGLANLKEVVEKQAE